MSETLPGPVAWLRVAPVETKPVRIDLPDGISILGCQDAFDGYKDLLIWHKDLPEVPAGGVIPLVRLRWIQQEPIPIWEPISTMEDV
ncbi:MAG: hypothetical protein C4575_12840 [Desulforudis sp.]|nr:MAG: hypothetical protein C4575_12840 [Desulforudis sp.]